MAAECFRANSVTAALEEVQRKLGPDALVLSVRQLPADPAWQVWREPMVEVMALPPGEVNLAPEPAGAAPVAPAAAQPATAQAAASRPKNSFLETLYAAAPAAAAAAQAPEPSRAEHIVAPFSPPQARQAAVNAPAVKFPAAKPAPARPAVIRSAPAEDEEQKPAEGLNRAMTRMRDLLARQGVDAGMLQRMLAECKESLSVGALASEDRLRKFISAQMQAALRVRQSSAALKDRVVCMVGPSGAGKTSMCAKLAAYHQNLGRSVVWISVDTFKAGAISESQFYTGALGVPLHIAYTPAELAYFVSEAAGADLVLVDTQKVNPYLETSLVHLFDYLTVLADRSIYLTLSANAKDNDLNQAVSALRPFNLAGLIFTHLDETNSFGNLFNLVWLSRLPMIYFSKGTRVLDDLLPAQADFLTQFIFDEKAID